MKRIIFLALLCAAMVGVAQASHNDVRVSFGFFYSSLTPHGEWIELDAGYHVWRPIDVRHNWHPYLYGRWVWTAHGWYWVSYEPFGWAVFHYGRWYYDDFYGWVWIPGYEWGPAWVEWRYNDDYIGWAPLPPQAVFSFSIGIHFTRTWAAPVHYWRFVSCRYFTAPQVVQHVVPVEQTRRWFGNTRTSSRYAVDNGRIVNRGVDVEFVERRGGQRIERVEVTQTRERGKERLVRQGGRERVEVYRPNREEIDRASATRIEARRSERRISPDVEIREREGSTRRERVPEMRRNQDQNRSPESLRDRGSSRFPERRIEQRERAPRSPVESREYREERSEKNRAGRK